MVDLPNFGDRVKVFPMPGRRVQQSEVATLDGGHLMGKEGKEVAWSSYWHRRLLAGDVLLHEIGDVRQAEQAKEEPVEEAAADNADDKTEPTIAPSLHLPAPDLSKESL